MSELRQALDAILRVNFREPVATNDQARIASFLERAAQELVQREEAVATREQAVSQRESNAELRESEASQRLKALTSMEGLARVIDLKPAAVKGRRRWLQRS
jgi:hypothetical protein